MNSPSPNTVPATTRRAFRRVTGGLIIAVLIGTVIWYWWTTPDRLTRQAERQISVDPVGAERLAAQALEASGDRHARAWLVRCRAFLRLDKPVEAAGCFGSISQPEAADQDALLDMAEDAHEAGQALLADLALGAALKQPSRGLRLQRALLQIRSQRLPATEVEELLVELEQSAARDADTWTVIAEARRSRGELAKALSAYRVAVDLPVGRVSAAELRGRLAQLLIDLGEYEEAQPIVAENFKTFEPTVDDYVRLAILYRFNGQRPRALAELGRALAAQPGHTTARLLKAAILWDSGHQDEAVAELQATVQANPYHPEAHYRLALALQRLGNADSAAHHFAEQTRLARAQREVLNTSNLLYHEPQNRELMRRLANLHRELGQVQMAERWEKQADQPVQLEPIR